MRYRFPALPSPVNIECRVRQITPLGAYNLILADVVAVTIDDAYMDEAGKFHLNDTGLITYSHGEYFLLGKSSARSATVCGKILLLKRETAPP